MRQRRNGTRAILRRRVARASCGALVAAWATCATSAPALGAGCGSPDSSPTLLPDLPGLELVATSKADTGQCFLEVHYASACIPRLPVLEVWLDGAPLAFTENLTDFGVKSCDRGQVFKCTQPVSASAAPASFYVTDGTTTALFQVDELTVPRALTLVQPTDGVLRAGATVVLEVRPTVADLAWQPPTTVRLRGDASRAIVLALDTAHGLSASASTFSFVVPPGLPRGLAGHLEVDRSLDLPVVACTLAQRCRAATLSSLPAPAAVRTAP